MPAKAQERIPRLFRAPLGDGNEREFLTWWTTWWDDHMVVADQIGEQHMDWFWSDLCEFGESICRF